MLVYVLERKPDSERHWAGYDLLDRIAVVAANGTEARLHRSRKPVDATTGEGVWKGRS